MNTAQYLEKRLKSLVKLCSEIAADPAAAISRYRAEIDAVDQTADSENSPVPFRQIVKDFSLNAFEADALFLSIAPTLDANFRQTLACMKRNFALSQIDVGTALDLFSDDFSVKLENRKSFSPSAPLFLHRLCELVPKLGSENQLHEMTIHPMPRIVAHILEQETDAELDGFSRVISPKTKLDDVVIPEKKRRQIMSLVDNYESCMAMKKAWGFEEIGGGTIYFDIAKFNALFPADEAKTLAEQDMKMVRKVAKHITAVMEKVDAMVNARKVANKLDEERAKAIAYHDTVQPLMDEIRYHIDKLELIVDNEMWPLPKYRELLFIR